MAARRFALTTLCRECSALFARPPPGARCGRCGSPRLISHPELAELTIAHIDCDAFYATVEKRDRPQLAVRPVIVGGGKRGVVLACCYIARLYGVRSAMPMFKALAACPEAEVIRPNMTKYRDVGRVVRAEVRKLTPSVEPISIDEAFLDLMGTEALHGAAPAQMLVEASEADRPTLFERELGRPRRLERAIDNIRDKLGEGALHRGARARSDGRESACGQYFAYRVPQPRVIARQLLTPSAVGLAQCFDVLELRAD